MSERLGQLYLNHLWPECNCRIVIAGIVWIDGAEVELIAPECANTPVPGRSGRVQDLMAQIFEKTGRAIIRRQTAERLLMNRCKANPFVGPLELLRAVRPVWKSFNACYYFVRDVASAVRTIRRPRCDFCGRGVCWEEWDHNNCGDFCNKTCFHNLIRALAEKQEQERQQRKEFRCLNQQIRAMREFLKNGNPAVFSSLPEGFGPAKTSPAS